MDHELPLHRARTHGQHMPSGIDCLEGIIAAELIGRRIQCHRDGHDSARMKAPVAIRLVAREPYEPDSRRWTQLPDSVPGGCMTGDFAGVALDYSPVGGERHQASNLGSGRVRVRFRGELPRPHQRGLAGLRNLKKAGWRNTARKMQTQSESFVAYLLLSVPPAGRIRQDRPAASIQHGRGCSCMTVEEVLV
jgi:hypothetical protein